MAKALLVLSATCLAAAALAPAASAATTKAIWGPLDEASFDKYRELGVDVYQMQLSWRAAAPTEPADPTAPAGYTWPPAIDQAIARASARGIQVALLVRQTPTWATSPPGGPHNDAPAQVQDYAEFVTAARKKYPLVNRWMIWGETNRRAVWNTKAGDPDEGPWTAPDAPVKYAQLLDAAYVALKATPPATTVVGGMTFTYGDIAPAQWISRMSLGGGRPRMDEYGHNPFSRRCPDLSQGPMDPNNLEYGARDISDVDTLKGDLAAAFGSAKRLWLSEYTISSDRSNRSFEVFVSRATQADWLARALRIAGAPGSGVAGLGWFNLSDENAPNGLTTGLLDTAGNRKPAFHAYKATTTNEGLAGSCTASPPTAPTGDRLPPHVSLTGASKVRLRTLRKKGYAFKFRCSEDCRVSASLLIDKRTARRTRLKRRARSAVLVGNASNRLGRPVRRKMRVKLTRKAKARLRRARRGKLTLRLTVTDSARNAGKHSKTIRLIR